MMLLSWMRRIILKRSIQIVRELYSEIIREIIENPSGARLETLLDMKPSSQRWLPVVGRYSPLQELRFLTGLERRIHSLETFVGIVLIGCRRIISKIVSTLLRR